MKYLATLFLGSLAMIGAQETETPSASFTTIPDAVIDSSMSSLPTRSRTPMASATQTPPPTTSTTQSATSTQSPYPTKTRTSTKSPRVTRSPAKTPRVTRSPTKTKSRKPKI